MTSTLSSLVKPSNSVSSCSRPDSLSALPLSSPLPRAMPIVSISSAAKHLVLSCQGVVSFASSPMLRHFASYINLRCAAVIGFAPCHTYCVNLICNQALQIKWLRVLHALLQHFESLLYASRRTAAVGLSLSSTAAVDASDPGHAYVVMLICSQAHHCVTSWICKERFPAISR